MCCNATLFCLIAGWSWCARSPICCWRIPRGWCRSSPSSTRWATKLHFNISLEDLLLFVILSGSQVSGQTLIVLSVFCFQYQPQIFVTAAYTFGRFAADINVGGSHEVSTCLIRSFWLALNYTCETKWFGILCSPPYLSELLSVWYHQVVSWLLFCSHKVI